LHETTSFVWQLWNADRTDELPDLAALRDDIINCLDVANRKLNGPVPTESKNESRNTQVIVDLAYPMSGILTNGLRYLKDWTATDRFDMATHGLLADCLCRIGYAWDQVLAGDIDDLLEGYEYWIAK